MPTTLIRIRNRVLQVLYRSKLRRPCFLSAEALEELDAIDRYIEEKITPLFWGFIS